MQESSHFRAVSLVLAFSVVVAGWLLFEYGNHKNQEIAAPIGSSANPAMSAPVESSVVPGQAPLHANTVPGNMALTFRCEKNGRTSYSDRPCAEKERLVSITASEKEPPVQNNLEQLQERLAAMEKARHQREMQYATATLPQSDGNAGDKEKNQKIRCKQIDDAIAVKDSELRQSHFAQTGDSLTSERKKLTDERFSLGC